MSSPRQVLSVDVAPLKPLIEQRAAQAHLTPSRWAREVLASAVGAEPAPVARAAAHRKPGGRDVKFTACLTPEESGTLLEKARAAGVSQAEYVARLISGDQATLLSRQALDTLAQSNLQLLAIGRNLNQVARALNADPGCMSAADSELIVQAARESQAHIRQVLALIGELESRRRTRGRHRR